MQKSLVYMLMAVSPLVAVVALAQTTTIMPAAPQGQNQRQVIRADEVVEADNRNIMPPQQVYVVQNAPNQNAPNNQQQAPAVVMRPQQVTVVEDTPLKESRAEGLRRSRMEVEAETEQRIVERLESERMRAEKERSDRIAKALEGKAEEPAPVQPAVQQVPIVQPMQMQPIQQAPVVAVVEPMPVVSASSESIKDDLQPVEEKTRFYVSGLGGFGDYPGISNIKGVYAAGVSVGMIFPERLIAEGSLLFSTYDVEPVTGYLNPVYPMIKQMDQTNVTAGVKYQIMDGRIRPTIGVLGGYTRRIYSDRQYYRSSPDVTSHAFDVGVSTGADVELSKTFSMGMDFKYFWNMTYRVDTAYQTSMVNPQQFGRPVEGLEYYLLTFGARLTF